MRELPHYKQGPQGNLIPDFRAEYLQRYGKADPDFVPGTPGIKDRRVIFDATETGTMLLADRASRRNGDVKLEKQKFCKHDDPDNSGLCIKCGLNLDEDDRGF